MKRTVQRLLHRKVFIALLCVMMHMVCVYAQTPVQKNGQLGVCGTKLCNQWGNPIQLRGMSTHGIQWYGWGSCLTEASLNALANDWGSDVLRISMYVQEGGYETDPVFFTNQVKTLVNEATERGMYALIDFHQLSPGDPNHNTARAKTFFAEMANTFKDQNNIIYDICNEPNGVGWNTIRNYATQVIPVIRNIDSNAVVLCGTHGWSTFGVSGNGTLQDVVNNPLPYTNVMYTFHFYAGSHGTEYYNMLNNASDVLPVFVTEFGTQNSDGDGTNNFTRSQQYLDLMRTKKISWCNWNYSDDFRSGAVWKEGTCSAGPWTTTQLKPAGVWIRDRMLAPADDFPGGGNLSPTASITSPVNGATFASPATVTISANASDADGTVTKVEFFQGVTKLGEDLNSPYTFTWSDVAAGTYSLTAKATDNLGATGTSTAVTITVSGPPPCVPAAASTDDGNVAANVLDGNLATRWSASGDPQWIQFCLDAAVSKTVNGVKIAFYSGNVRQSRFDIQTSTDGITWAAAASNLLSSGTTTALETFSFSSRSARFVRIVGHGNTVNAWNSYTEVQVQIVSGNTAPVASITSPAAGSTFNAPASVSIAASATDADGTVTKVEFFNGATKLGEDTSAPYNFVWNNVPAGAYSITAVATDNLGATGTSAAINITVNPPPTGLPAPWTNADIGAVASAGSATYSAGTFTVNGSGADIWAAADEFHFVSQPASGDVEVTARVSSITNTNGFAKAGAMIRESSGAGSANALVAITPANGVTFQRRTATGATSVSTRIAGITTPVWVRVKRAGNTFTAFYSADGITWTTIGSEVFTMAASVQVGLAVTSHADGTVATAPFTDVSVTSPCAEVTASADDGNVAANVLDNDLNTRWSASGDGQWIQFCLGAVSPVSGVQIAFYKGNERSSTFDVLVSSDGSTFTTAATGLASSGTSLALENFSFTSVNARHVRIVGHGNNLNLWNSYTEVRISTGAALASAESASLAQEALSSHPNPAEGSEIVISYELKNAGPVRLQLYHSGTRQTITLLSEDLPAGKHEFRYSTESLSRGLHLIKLIHQGEMQTHRILKK